LKKRNLFTKSGNDKYNMDEANNNVLIFPSKFPMNLPTEEKVPIKTLEDIKTNITLLHAIYINEVIETILPIISNQLTTAGFSIGSEASLKDGALFVESFRAMLCKQYGIFHPFNKLANALFHEEEGALRMVAKIDINFVEK
jgi:hypothetical protein